MFPTSNGVVIHSEEKKVISAINCDGHKKLKSFQSKNKIIFWHFPFIRGIQFFLCGIIGFLEALLLSYDLCNPTKIKDKDINKYYTKKLIGLGIVAVGAILFSAVIFGFVPGKLGYLAIGFQGSTILRNVVVVVVKIFLFYVFVLLLRCFSSVNELFRFNRAGDVVVNLSGLNSNEYINKKYKSKQKKEKNIKNETKIQKQKTNKADMTNKKPNKKVLSNQPLNFLNYLIFVFVLDFLVVTLCGVSYGFWFNLFFHIAILFACMSVGYEILWLLDKSSYNLFRGFAYLTEFLVYAKPSTTHLETALVATTEINLLNTQKGREYMEDETKKAFSVVYTEVKNKLTNAGINEKSDVDWLIATVLGKNRAEIKLVPFVTDKQYQDIIKAADRRAKGESLDNIFGYTEFYGLRYDVNKKVLTPRMETEILVEQVLKAEKNFKSAKILDLGTGSGAIAVALAKNCDASITAVDISKVALITAENNAKKNDVKVEFLHSNLFDGLKRKRKFDIIVSNPPYIPSQDIKKLDKNVRECDPILALDGGEDGLDFYREIISKSTSRLNGGGMIFFEVGKGQAPAVKKLLRANGFEEIKIIKDYNKIERVICGKYK